MLLLLLNYLIIKTTLGAWRIITSSYKFLDTNSSSAYEQLKTYGMRASLSGIKFLSIPGDLVTEVIVNLEVKILAYSTSAEVADDIILNAHALVKLQRALKNRINVKQYSNQK